MDDRMFGIDEMWMPSEPCWPRIILYVYPRARGEEGATDRDSGHAVGLDLRVDPQAFFHAQGSALPVPPCRADHTN
jgi:hypothetical protein